MQNATNFLVQAIIGFALYIVLLRFWMQWVRADFRNELGQFVISVTNPLVIPLRKVLPPLGTIDTATIVLALLVSLLKIFAYFLLTQYQPNVIQYLIFAAGLFLKASIYLFFAAILIGVIASWINPHSYHPILSVARSISEPLLAPARKIIPAIGGIDFSPMVVLLFMQFSLYIIWEYLLPIPV